MLSLRFTIVSLTLILLVIAGLAALPFGYALAGAILAFALAWLARPLEDLRIAMRAFKRSVMMKRELNTGSIVTIMVVTLATYILLPTAFYVIGRLIRALGGWIF